MSGIHVLCLNRMVIKNRRFTYIIMAANIIGTVTIFSALAVFLVVGILNRYRTRSELKTYNIYTSIVSNMIENILKKQHDHRNNIAALAESCDNDDMQKLSDRLEDITRHSVSDTAAYSFLHMENQLLVGLLYCKYQDALYQNKDMQVQINMYNYKSRARDLEIVDMAGVLIDNALEATSDSEKIYITIGKRLSEQTDHRFYLQIENPGPMVSEDVLKKMFSPYVTSKEDKSGHGLGLNILKNTVKKYEGMLTVTNTYPEGTETPYMCISILI